MKFLVKKGIALKQKTACLVFGVFEGKLQGELLVELDQQAGGSYMQAVRSKEFTGAKGESLLLLRWLPSGSCWWASARNRPFPSRLCARPPAM